MSPVSKVLHKKKGRSWWKKQWYLGPWILKLRPNCLKFKVYETCLFLCFFLRGNLTSIQAFWWNLSGWILAFWKSYQLQNLQGGPRIQLQIGWNIPKKRNSYPFIRPLIGLITPLIICKPPLQYDAGSRKPCPQTRLSTKSDILHSRKLTRHNPLTGKWSSQASWKRLLLLQPGPSPKPNNEATGPIYYICIYIYILYST